MSSLKLEDLTGVLSDAANEAQKQAEESAHERFNSLFEDPDGDGVYTPKYKTVKIGEETIKIPMLVFMTLTGIKTKEITFDLDTDLDLGGHESKDGDTNINVSLKKGLFKNTSHLKISAIFEGTDPPEALRQLQDEFNNRISHAMAKLEQEDL